jgi:hypothetical protein
MPQGQQARRANGALVELQHVCEPWDATTPTTHTLAHLASLAAAVAVHALAVKLERGLAGVDADGDGAVAPDRPHQRRLIAPLDVGKALEVSHGGKVSARGVLPVFVCVRACVRACVCV